jgi:hypothetical protein
VAGEESAHQVEPGEPCVMVAIGDNFSSTFAGGMARWRVTSQPGPEVWLAEIVDERPIAGGSVYDGANAGVRRAFTTDEIEAALAGEATAAALRDAHALWWASRSEGDVVHHDLGAGEFIRGIVVIEGGVKRMRATALLGNWSELDLPQRDRDGSVYVPLHAEAVLRGTTMQPHLESMYEAPAYSRAEEVSDPRLLEPIDLSLREPFEWEATEYARVQLADQVVQALSDETVSWNERFSRARELLIEPQRRSRVGDQVVDPDALLREMWELVEGMRDAPHPLNARFVELFTVLDRWLRHGGLLPRQWDV